MEITMGIRVTEDYQADVERPQRCGISLALRTHLVEVQVNDNQGETTFELREQRFLSIRTWKRGAAFRIATPAVEFRI